VLTRQRPDRQNAAETTPKLLWRAIMQKLPRVPKVSTMLLLGNLPSTKLKERNLFYVEHLSPETGAFQKMRKDLLPQNSPNICEHVWGK